MYDVPSVVDLDTDGIWNNNWSSKLWKKYYSDNVWKGRFADHQFSNRVEKKKVEAIHISDSSGSKYCYNGRACIQWNWCVCTELLQTKGHILSLCSCGSKIRPFTVRSILVQNKIAEQEFFKT